MKQKKKANARFYSELRQTDSWVVVELTDIKVVADDGGRISLIGQDIRCG
jgi:hypothetical protein